MCGIAGLVNFKENIDLSFGKKVHQMCADLTHRGPDGDGFFQDSGVYFGHRRLAILDLTEKGKQPMQNSDGNLVITFNGEIYNYKEILAELGAPLTKSGTDTEVILLAYKKWGKDCVLKFRGMFAFAIYDKQARTVFLARDHFGQKPLFYSWQEDFFCFSSEVVPLARVLPVKPKINRQALLSFFLRNYRHIPDPLTIFEKIFSLEPGTIMVVDIDTKKLQKSSYLKPDYTHKLDCSESELVDKYKTLLQECVELTTVSDVPVGILLSGGVDSSSIAAVLAGKKYDSFAVGSNRDDDELVRARNVAALCHTNHHEIIVDNINFADMVEVITKVGQPYNLLSAFFSLQIVKEARALGIKVLIGGNGADEIFYGYDGASRLRTIDMMISLLPGRAKIRQFIKPYLYRRAAKKKLCTLFTKEFEKSLGEFDVGQHIKKIEDEVVSDSLIERNYFVGLMSENQHSVTTIGDITGMSSGLEIRTPFLDPTMFNFAAQLPVEMKVRDMFAKKRNKYIMRRALDTMLGSEIAWASKKGFGFHFDLHDLVINKWKKEVENILFTVVLQTDFFDQHHVRQIWDRCLRGDKSQTSVVWGLVSFGIFMKEVYYI